MCILSSASTNFLVGAFNMSIFFFILISLSDMPHFLSPFYQVQDCRASINQRWHDMLQSIKGGMVYNPIFSQIPAFF